MPKERRRPIFEGDRGFDALRISSTARSLLPAAMTSGFNSANFLLQGGAATAHRRKFVIDND
ncbi:hypothetical protein TAL182_CH03373 [Rhizobium sp. TAL182]|nr:hypothetical protein TAL182_CH03373 [Rhizobium sp. TAL182]